MSDTQKTPPLDGSEAHAEQRWPHLIVLHGWGVGQVHRIVGKEATIGRDSTADIRIDHPTVSRRHARVSVTDDGVFIQDLGSTNGTLVGINTVRGRRSVPDGAVIALGRASLLKMTFSAALDDVLRRTEYERATRDLATRVASLDYIRDQLRIECAFARRHRSPLTLVMFRADEVPSNADEDWVDSIMGMLAVAITEATRDEDVMARSGRDTFVVLLRADENQAARMAERVRGEAIRAMSSAAGSKAPQTITCAVGQLGATALALPGVVMEWAARELHRAAGTPRDHVIRLLRLESPAFVRKSTR
jgi:diguanylate cyclase (GGDEF)-like protein